MNKHFLIISLILIAGVMITYSVLSFKSEKDNTDFENNVIAASEVVNELDWCVEHSVPESECTGCDPSLIQKFKDSNDWCGGHDLPESHCRLCNPEIVFPQEEQFNNESDLDWCIEHSVPESECALCDPSLIDQYKASGDWCGGHSIPESHCRLCNPEITFPQEEILKIRNFENSENEIEVSLFFRPNQDVCATNDALIQFASSETADRSGISVSSVIEAPYETALDAPAEIVFDENETTVISSSVRVLVSRWIISPGDVVNKDDPIAILHSSEMAELQARLLSAYAELELQRKELERDKALLPQKHITESEYERRTSLHKKAQSEYISSRGLLLSCGINNQDVDKLLEANIVSKEFILRSPSSGIIAKRIAKLGELLDDGEALAILTDPSSLWIEARLSEAQIKNVSIGSDLLFASDEGALNRVKGTIIWISPYLDQHTRMGIVRAQVTENAQILRAGEFGRVTVSDLVGTESILVPKDAVQWEGCCNVVFVKESSSRFRPRKVELADGPGSYYQVTQGLFNGEEVVVNGSFLLKTELKKTSIGAGCCSIEPVG